MPSCWNGHGGSYTVSSSGNKGYPLYKLQPSARAPGSREVHLRHKSLSPRLFDDEIRREAAVVPQSGLMFPTLFHDGLAPESGTPLVVLSPSESLAAPCCKSGLQVV